MSREVPEGWQLGKLGSFVEEFKVLDSAGDLPPLSVTKSSGIVFQSDKFNKRIANASSGNYKVIKNGEYSYDPMSLYYGAIGRLKVCDAGIVSPAYITFRLKGALDTAFFDLYVKTGDFLVQVNKVTTGGNQDGKRKKTDWNSFCSLPIALPPLHEQRRIAEILSSFEEAIAATRAVIEQTKKVKQGVLERLLTKGIGHTRFKRTEIGEISEGWNTGRVDDFFVLQRGFDITEKQVLPGNYPVVSSSGVSYFHSKAMIEGPAVITGRKGKLGRVHYIEGPSWPHDTTLWVKNFKGNDPKFVYWVLRSLNLERLDAATAVPTLNRNVVHAERCAFPPINEQRQIADYLDSLELTGAEQDKALDGTMSIKSALMSDLLTGRKRVTETLLLAAE